MGYPPIPWLGIMLVGFGSGKLFEFENHKRNTAFVGIGLTSLVLFLILRSVNIYGDPVPWTSQKTFLFSFLSFINISKYPPSLLFYLVTLGIMFLILAFSEKLNYNIKKILMVYGKVPLFYFVLHFYLIHIITIIVLLGQGFNWTQLEFATGTFGRPKAVESGLPLWSIFIIWVCVVLALYKPCLWFGKIKSTHKQWWFKYV